MQLKAYGLVHDFLSQINGANRIHWTIKLMEFPHTNVWFSSAPMGFDGEEPLPGFFVWYPMNQVEEQIKQDIIILVEEGNSSHQSVFVS